MLNAKDKDEKTTIANESIIIGNPNKKFSGRMFARMMAVTEIMKKVITFPLFVVILPPLFIMNL